jgi:hypothetical protein
MDAKFKKGDPVVQAMPRPVRGRVQDLGIDRDSGEIQYLVDTDGDPETPGRWFKGSELLADKPAEEAGQEGGEA